MTAGVRAEDKTRERADGKRGPRVLLIGYLGANNTGAEALLLSDIEDIRAMLGPNLRIVHMPTIFPLKLWWLVSQHDIVLLVEGSAYMDSWTSALL